MNFGRFGGGINRNSCILGWAFLDTLANNERNSPYNASTFLATAASRQFFPPVAGGVNLTCVNVDVNNNTGAGAVFALKFNNIDTLQIIPLGTAIGNFQDVTNTDGVTIAQEIAWQYRNFDGTIIINSCASVINY